MKQTLLVIAFSLAIISAKAQTFWRENWTGTSCAAGCTTYTGPNGAWTTMTIGYNGPAANVWYFSNAEQGMGRGVCGSNAGTHPSAHIGNVSTSPAASVICPSGDCGAMNDDWPGAPSDGTNVRLRSPVINCTGQSSITLSFNYILQGDSVHDYATVSYYNGTTWSQLVKPHSTVNTSCSGQGLWTHFSVALPASANNNPNVQIGFTWFNDTLGTASLTNNPVDWPAIAIDSIALTSAPLGIQSYTQQAKVSLYPNPSNGKFTVEITGETKQTRAYFEVYNALGKHVSTFSVNGQGINEIELSDKPTGIYMYRLLNESGEQISNGRFLID